MWAARCSSAAASGRSRRGASWPSRSPPGAALAAVGYLVAPTPWALLPVMFLGGMLAAPAAIVSSALLDRVLSVGSLGRGYGLLVSVGLVAAAIGNTAAGSLAAVLSPRDLLLGAPVLLTLGVAVAMIGRRTSARRPGPTADT